MCRPARWRTRWCQDWTGSQLLLPAAGESNIVDELKAGKQLGGKTYKVHLDGYNQMGLITGQDSSERHEMVPLRRGNFLGAIRINDDKYRFIDQPQGWLGGTVKPDFADSDKPESGSV